MTPIPPLVRTSPTFKADCDLYFATRIPLLTTEIADAQTDITTKQGIASAAATAATGAAGAAIAAATQTGSDRTQTGIDAANAHSDSQAAASSAATAVASANAMATGTAAGTPNAITCAFSPAITALGNNRACLVAFAAANTSTTPTFQADATVAHTITARGGQALLVGDISRAGYVGLLMYQTSTTSWELCNPGLSITLTTQYAHSARATLRTLGSAGQTALVESLGLFLFVAGSAEPDDDETCFAAAGGCWELKAADPDFVFGAWLADFDELQARAADLEARATGHEAQLAYLLGSGSTPLPRTVITSGTGNYIVPANTYRAFFEAWAGGAGANAGSITYFGNGGSYCAGWFAVTPGQVIPYVIGAGGSGPTAGGNTTILSLSAIGGAVAGTTPAIATGGDIQIPGGLGYGNSAASISQGGAGANGGCGGLQAGSTTQYNGSFPGGGAANNGSGAGGMIRISTN